MKSGDTVTPRAYVTHGHIVAVSASAAEVIEQAKRDQLEEHRRRIAMDGEREWPSVEFAGALIVLLVIALIGIGTLLVLAQ